MVTVFWKGGTSNNPDTKSNWVTASGGSTEITTDEHNGLANGTTDVVMDYSTSGTTHCAIASGTAKKNWKSLTINYHASLEQIVRIDNSTLTLRGMIVKKGNTLQSSNNGKIILRVYHYTLQIIVLPQIYT